MSLVKLSCKITPEQDVWLKTKGKRKTGATVRRLIKDAMTTPSEETVKTKQRKTIAELKLDLDARDRDIERLDRELKNLQGALDPEKWKEFKAVPKLLSGKSEGYLWVCIPPSISGEMRIKPDTKLHLAVREMT